MITNDGRTREWLEHRTGVRPLSNFSFQCRTRSLESNEKFGNLQTTLGKKEIQGFVGFIDLGDFSDRVQLFSPREISRYLQPFLSGVITAATQAEGLVDKTIGDEVMVVLPEYKDDGGIAAILNLSFFMSLLNELQNQLGEEYPFRFGFAYGDLYIDQVHGKGYSEFTLAGRVIILAKRLATLEKVKSGGAFSGALGVLSDETAEERLQSFLQYFAIAPFECAPLEAPSLKGINSFYGSTIIRKECSPTL